MSTVIMAVPGVRPVLKRLGLSPRLHVLARQFMMARLPNPLTTQGLTLYWHPRAPTDVPELAAGVYESDTRLLVERYLSPGMTMVDLGGPLGVLFPGSCPLCGADGEGLRL